MKRLQRFMCLEIQGIRFYKLFLEKANEAIGILQNHPAEQYEHPFS